ncbi:MAG: hypothetical protein A2W00_04540 [Candidatus Eisenbacteria bacterium RBG_16_71_46]|nr:MAG: hypothetical protein A2W00_04540 [Candidatus Eisenbacteria bacterium RBG_16_71_46]
MKAPLGTIYLAGYTGRKPERLRDLATQLDAIVCDIRYAPRSRAPYWSKEALETPGNASLSAVAWRAWQIGRT